MPLYSDSSYYYSGGSSQLFSPYSLGLYTNPASTSAGAYLPYSSTYNRPISGSYLVPLSIPRTPTYTTHTHGLSSRYQPKLSTITETSSSRHNTLIPLTRMQSPKFHSTYSTPSTTTSTFSSKYIPPRPISINTADIDVSASRYRKRKEDERELKRKSFKETTHTSPTTSIRRTNSAEKQDKAPDLSSDTSVKQAEEPSERHANRSTIKRDRAVVRLSTVRSRAKDTSSKSSPTDMVEPEPDRKRFRDLPHMPEPLPAAENLNWRQKLAEDMAAMPAYPLKKSPGELIRERYLIQEVQPDHNAETSKRRLAVTDREAAQPIEEVIVELDPLHHTIRRLSIPQCPSFHDICEDISSDKIDDDLNAGELRRRASLIQEQEQEILNQLQKSTSGTFQLIHLERRGSQDSVEGDPSLRQSLGKRKSRKSKKIRHKITAIVDVENAPLTPIIQEKEEDLVTPAEKQVTTKPKFTFNVEDVEEHHTIHKIFKLPKKRSSKKTTKTKEVKEVSLPEGFVQAIPKAKNATKVGLVKKKPFVSAAEVFTFDKASIEKVKAKEMELAGARTPEATTPLGTETFKLDTTISHALVSDIPKIESPNIDSIKMESKKIDSPKIGAENIDTSKINSTQIESPKIDSARIQKMDSPKIYSPKLETPKSPPPLSPNNLSMQKEPLSPKLFNTSKNSMDDFSSPKPFNKAMKPSSPKLFSTAEESLSPKLISSKTATAGISKPKSLEKTPVLKSAASLDSSTLKLTTKSNQKVLEKSQSLNTPELKSLATPTQFKPSFTTSKPIKEEEEVREEEPKSLVATPKPIRKLQQIEKSDSGEDFWSQIGTRETLYMTNRKKTSIENQEDILESQTSEDVTNLHDIQVTTQKTETLKKADLKCSRSNESTLCKTSPKKALDIKLNTKLDAAKVISQTKTLTPDIEKKNIELVKKTSPKTVTSPTVETNKSYETIIKSIKSDQKTSPANILSATKVISTEQQAELPTEFAKAKKTDDAAEIKPKPTQIAPAKITEPKISVGQVAKKSPEQKDNKDTTSINNASVAAKIANAATAGTTDLAATSTTKTAATKSATTTTTNTTKIPTTATVKLPEAEVNKLTETQHKSKTTDTGAVQPKGAGSSAAKTSPTLPTVAAAAAKMAKTTQPSIATTTATINADQFITMAPAKSTTSPTKTKNASPTATRAAAKGTTTTPAATSATDKGKTSATPAPTPTKVIPSTTTTPSAAPTTTTTVPKATTTATSPATAAAVVAASPPSVEHKSPEDDDSGKNLSKFATVSNLAQCLQDVDADIADYIPSSAEDSSDYSDSDNSFDYSAYGIANLTESMKKKLRRQHKKEKLAQKEGFDPQKKIKINPTNKCYVKEEAPRYPLVATPRPLWKREKIVYTTESSDESDSEESDSTEETDEESEECTTSEEYEDDMNTSGAASSSNASKEESPIIRMSTCSNDSGFEGGTAPSSPKKMLECDVNCHKKCERLTANLCGVNQKLIVEALAFVKRGTRETRDSPSTPPSLNPAYKIEANDERDETSYTYSQFQKSGRFTAPATVIPRFKNYSVDDFHFLAVLGKGSFGKVLLAELRDTTYYYAVKCLKKDVVLEDDDVDSTLIERKVLALGTKHPYLCHLFCTFQTESHLFFVMEYLNGGDLMFHIQESGRFTEERARFYGAEIISGLKFLHKKGIIYRDLKLDNVLLDYEGHVRIADFGMCKLQIYLDKTADSFCGTPDYMAPEIIKGEKYNQNVDWWSFGVLLYEMLIGQSPFSGCDEDELFWSICNEIPWFPVYISAEATGILKGLLEKDYTKRIGSQYSPAGDISDHIFFRPIDWKLLEKRQLPPPFKPQVKHPLDTQYFDRVFTRERVRLTPIDKDILASMDQKQFLGFTYTNPHITLD